MKREAIVSLVSVVLFLVSVFPTSVHDKVYASDPVHDVAVTNVAPYKTVVGQGYGLNVTVTAADLGDYTETFNLTVYANTTSFASQNVTLSGGTSTNINFTWNTTGFAYGNCAISAYASPVPSELDTANNNYTSGAIVVSVPGDVNGDFKVSLTDLVTLAVAYSSKPGDANWNPNADIDNNGIADLSDLVILAQHYGQNSTEFTVVGTLTYMPLRAIYAGINVESVNPVFLPNVVGSSIFIAVNGQIGSRFPVGFVSGDRVSIFGTISLDTHSQTYVLNMISIAHVT